MEPRDPFAAVRTLETWGSCDREREAASFDGVVDGFRFTGALVGLHRLPELIHDVTGTRTVIIPGGNYTMGFSDDEIRECVAALGDAGGPWPGLYRRFFAEAPARRVDVRPFICSQAPVLDTLAARFRPDVVRSCPLTEDESETGSDPLTPEEAAAEEERWAREWVDDELNDDVEPYPSFVGAEEATSISSRYGARAIAEIEWEYVARAGGSSSWIAPDPWRFVGNVHAHPRFEHGSTWTRETSNPMGIWGLAFPEWTTLFVGERLVLRGGAVMGYPWQDSPEMIGAHAATRGLWRGNGCVRLAWDLPR